MPERMPDNLSFAERLEWIRSRTAAAGLTEEEVLATLEAAEDEPIEDQAAYEAHMKELEKEWQQRLASASTPTA